jgi:NhaP-type Na+/H+ or K+/H+ antiporter
VTALLAFVAIASHAHHPGGGTGGGTAQAPSIISDYLATIALVVMPIGAVLVVWGLAHRRRQAALEGRSNWRRQLMAAGVIALLLAGIVGGVTGKAGPQKQEKNVAAPHQPKWQWLPVLILGSLVFAFALTAGVMAAQVRRNRSAYEDEAELARALDEVLSDSLDDLRAERDARRAVIRAYARMEKTFAAYGVPREEHETPLEYVGRALDSLSVSSYAVRRLVQLFERAKFSPHAVGPAMKDDAIEALAGLRSELEVQRMEAA